MKILAKNIRYLRKRHNLSQEQLAVMLGKKTFTTIQKWETNKAEPSMENVVKIAAFFQVNIDDLVKVDLEIEDLGYSHRKLQLSRMLAYAENLTDAEVRVIQSISELSNDVKDSIIHQIQYEHDKAIKKKIEANSTT